jgi:predicted GIY-YIG superfamily endonuclease
MGANQQRATWGHPQVAINIAQWISPEIGLRVMEWLSHTCNRTRATQKLVGDATFKIRLRDDTTLDIGIRPDGFVNATQLCKAGGKLFADYNRSKQTQDYLQALSSNMGIPITGSCVMGIPITGLIDIQQGGINQGTYVHRKVAYHLAQWISPQFAVQVSNVLDELMITGHVELGNEKSNAEIETTYNKKLEDLTNRLERYEPSVFDTTIDLCPIKYHRKDVLYFLKFKVPNSLQPKYLSSHPQIADDKFACIKFGVTSDLEQRLVDHRGDKQKDNIIFIHAIELENRYDASKIESYVKTITEQLGIKFKYERNKETIIVNEETFNMILAKIKEGIQRIDTLPCPSSEIEDSEIVEDVSNPNIKIEFTRLTQEHELQKQIQDDALDMMKSKTITFDQYKEWIREIRKI